MANEFKSAEKAGLKDIRNLQELAIKSTF